MKKIGSITKKQSLGVFCWSENAAIFGHNICVAWIVAFASHKKRGRKLAMVLLFSVLSKLGWKVVLKGRLPITISQFFLRSVRVKLKVTLHSCILNYYIQISFGKKPGYFTAIKHYRCWRKKLLDGKRYGSVEMSSLHWILFPPS